MLTSDLLIQNVMSPSWAFVWHADESLWPLTCLWGHRDHDIHILTAQFQTAPPWFQAGFTEMCGRKATIRHVAMTLVWQEFKKSEKVSPIFSIKSQRFTSLSSHNGRQLACPPLPRGDDTAEHKHLCTNTYDHTGTRPRGGPGDVRWCLQSVSVI